MTRRDAESREGARQTGGPVSKQVGSREQSHFPEVDRFMGVGLGDVAEKNLET